MKNLQTILILLFLSISTYAAGITKLNDVDNTKKVIQVGMFTHKDSIKWVTTKFDKKYDLFIKRYKNYHIVYIVNINHSNLKTTLHAIKSHYSDAFINHKVYFNKTTQVKYKDNKISTIKLGLFKEKEELHYILKLFSRKYSILINPHNNMYEVYIKDIKQSELNSLFKITKYKFPQAQVVAKKIISSDFNKSEVKEVNKIKVMTKPIDLDKLISSYENLPYLMYGRLQ